MERYQGPLLRFARTIAGPSHAADVVQDTFLRLVSARREDVEDKLTGWLFTVCKNRALEAKRAQKRETPVSEDAEMPASGPLADDVIARRNEHERVMKLIEGLPERHREIVALRFAGGLSYKEIAGATGLTETNVGFILHTALKTLKQRLDETANLKNTNNDPSRRAP